MSILVGRDGGSHRLMLTVNGQPMAIGQKSDVPDSVLQAHCMIEAAGTTVRIRNLDVNNDTFVNGQAVETKLITPNDRIALGKDRYPLDWTLLRKVLPPVADIRPLREVWDRYNQQRVELQIAERRFNSLRSATGLITMAAIALSVMTGRQSLWYVVLYALAILASLAFTVKAYRDASKVPQKQQDLNQRFQNEYVCPHCHRFLGNQSYAILEQNGTCSYCKAKFIH